jgi:hypothetical protein
VTPWLYAGGSTHSTAEAQAGPASACKVAGGDRRPLRPALAAPLNRGAWRRSLAPPALRQRLGLARLRCEFVTRPQVRWAHSLFSLGGVACVLSVLCSLLSLPSLPSRLRLCASPSSWSRSAHPARLSPFCLPPFSLSCRAVRRPPLRLVRCAAWASSPAGLLCCSPPCCACRASGLLPRRAAPFFANKHAHPLSNIEMDHHNETLTTAP